MMGTHISVGNLPSSAAEDQLRRLRAAPGEVASLSMVETESPVRYRGLGGSDMPALVGPGPAMLRPQRTREQAPAALPVWENGTLPGAMAGKRPSPNSIGPIFSPFSGGADA